MLQGNLKYPFPICVGGSVLVKKIHTPKTKNFKKIRLQQAIIL